MTTDGEIRQSPAPEPEGARAWVEFSARLGDIGKGVQQLVSDGRAARTLPLETPLVGSGTVPAGATTVTIDLGVPAMGRRWSVRSLAIAPASGLTGTLAGSVNWYVGNPFAFGPGEWCAPTMTTLPAFQFVGSDQINVTPSNHLFAVLTGGTAGQSAFARAYILDFPLYAGAPTIEL